MLKMKKQCEKCNTPTDNQDTAYICSFECTFCEACSTLMSHVCPNCSGELVIRPRRVKQPIQVAASQLKAKLFGKGK